MTAVASAPALAGAVDFQVDGRVRFGRVVASEWGKLWALRSTWGICAAGVLAQAGAAAIAPLATTATRNGVVVAAFDAARFPVVGLSLVQLVVLVLAVLAVTGEYSTGLARTTFTAVPSRLPVLWAKVVVVAATTVLVAVAGGAASLATGMASGGGLYGFELDGPQTVRLLASGPLYLGALAALAVGVAAMIRSTAGALGVLFGELLVVETLLASLSVPALQTIGAFLPQTAGLQLTRADDEIATMRLWAAGLPPWGGFAVLAGWVVLCLAGASVVVTRRDV